jgi:hypothetical protein
MVWTKLSIVFLAFIVFTTTSCETETLPGMNSANSGTMEGWLIPVNKVLSGGPGKDGIPALSSPDKIGLNQSGNDYLRDDDLVLGFKSGEDIIAYPHPILDWHEIINDVAGTTSIAVTYCPLTGTGIAWNRIIDNQITTFGVSGLLYNTNLIPYDRLTGSNWTQIGLLCVNGELRNRKPDVLPMIEMPWGTWKQLFPESLVVSSSTDYNRSYGHYPYGDYKTSTRLLFPAPEDNRLNIKERVLAIIKNDKAKVYRFDSFSEKQVVIHDVFRGENLAIIGKRGDYMIAFGSRMEDGEILNLKASETDGFLTDQEGNEWNLFGEAVRGPRRGEQLPAVTSFMGYWFSIAAFYPDPGIYEY